MSEELFRNFWWLMFPVFGMVFALFGVIQNNNREERILREAREKLERPQ